MKSMLLVINPRSGRCRAEKLLPQLQTIFAEAGYAVTIHTTTGRGDCTRVVAQKASDVDLVVCCGGDGTFNEAVNGLLESGAGTPIGYIPAGSTNDFAASLQLPTDLLAAARAITEGTPCPYDIGAANGKHFSYVLSFGAFTRASYATSQKIKNRLGFLAYVLSGIGEVFRLRATPVRVQVEDEILDGKFLFGAVSNSTRMGGIFKLDPQRVDMADGKLEMLLIRSSKNPFALLSCLWNFRKHRYDHPLIEFRTAQQFCFHCPTGTVWTVDGERYDAEPDLQIRDLHHAICLMKKG